MITREYNLADPEQKELAERVIRLSVGGGYHPIRCVRLIYHETSEENPILAIYHIKDATALLKLNGKDFLPIKITARDDDRTKSAKEGLEQFLGWLDKKTVRLVKIK